MNSIETSRIGSTLADLPRIQPYRTAVTLQGWKNIASELDRGVRTVQRWQRDLGLPVYRVGKRPRGPVFAFAEELHIWLRKTGGDLHSCADLSLVDHWTKSEDRIMKCVQEAKLVEDRQHYPQTRKPSKHRNLQAVIAFLSEESSRRPAGDCEQCHGPLRIVEGHFRISATKSNWVIPIFFCPICDLPTTGYLSAKDIGSDHRALGLRTCVEA